MKDIIEVANVLVGIWEILNFLFLIKMLAGGWGVVPYASNWNELLKMVLSLLLFNFILQLMVYGVTWWGQSQNADVAPFSGTIYLWGLRLSAICILWRTIWPSRDWIRNEPAPPRARLKLLGCALLASMLSSLPIA